MKAQNIYIKPFFKPLDTYNKPCFETAYLGPKVAQKYRHFFGIVRLFKKNHNEPQKVAKSAKNCPIRSPWSQLN